MESVSGKDLTDEDIQDLKGSAGVLFAAGVDTVGLFFDAASMSTETIPAPDLV